MRMLSKETEKFFFEQNHVCIANIALARITKTEEKKMFHSRKYFQKYKHFYNTAFAKLILNWLEFSEEARSQRNREGKNFLHEKIFDSEN